MTEGENKTDNQVGEIFLETKWLARNIIGGYMFLYLTASSSSSKLRYQGKTHICDAKDLSLYILTNSRFL